ncbi:MAG: hypothetical protein ACPIOQ_12035, partial [Promethearchaeia archaeon]
VAALNITFLGTQPTLTQVPPSRERSITHALAPCAAARRAANGARAEAAMDWARGPDRPAGAYFGSA